MSDSTGTVNSKVRVLLLAGGLGTRLRPLTLETPKCLIEIAGVPLLDYWVNSLRRAGVGEGRLNTHHLPDPVRRKLAEINRRDGLRLAEFYEPELLGSAGTVTANRDLADGADHCLLIYADNLSNVDLGAFLKFHNESGAPFTMLLFHTPYPKSCGIATLDSAGTIVEFVEKPEHPVSDLANGGVYAMTADSYREIADMGGFDIGYDVLPKFAGRMKGFVHDGYHRDIGTFESLEQAEIDVRAGLFGTPGNGER